MNVLMGSIPVKATANVSMFRVHTTAFAYKVTRKLLANVSTWMSAYMTFVSMQYAEIFLARTNVIVTKDT
jgi:hypothetical protein